MPNAEAYIGLCIFTIHNLLTSVPITRGHNKQRQQALLTYQTLFFISLYRRPAKWIKKTSDGVFCYKQITTFYYLYIPSRSMSGERSFQGQTKSFMG